MDNEVLEFANKIEASDLKEIFAGTEYRSIFKRRNYFLLKDIYLIVKISRNNVSPFWGVGEKFLELFNKLTHDKGNYYFVALESDNSGWFFSKKEIQNYISNGSLSYSEKQKQFKINNYNLRDQNKFRSAKDFLYKIGVE